MAYAGSSATADSVNALRELIKAECTRRNKNNSVSSYAGTSYDVNATKGSSITVSQGQKLFAGIRAINTGVANPSSGSSISIDALYNLYTTLHGKTDSQTSSTDTGCSTQCTGFCRSCTGSCTGTCTGTCAGGCTSSCAASCGGCGGNCWACGDVCPDNACGASGLK